jgi:hypothetical protein
LFFVGDLPFERLESIVEEDPSNGHGYYAAGVKFLAAGERDRAMQCFEKSAKCPNFMSSYPYYSRVILKRMREDSVWPEWWPANSSVAHSQRGNASIGESRSACCDEERRGGPAQHLASYRKTPLGICQGVSLRRTRRLACAVGIARQDAKSQSW